MPNRSSKRRKPDDRYAAAVRDVTELDTPPSDGKNPAAVALGRLGGLKGGKARAASLSARKRKEIARKAARARWAKHRVKD